MVLLDKNLKREERLLRAICMENIEAETKIIGFKKVLSLIEENQKNKAENIQSLIKVDVDLVEQFVNELRKLQQKTIQQFDELIANSTEWINNLNLFGQRDLKYNFYDELDVIIENKMQNSFNKDSIIDQIKSLNNSFSNKISSSISVLRNEKLYSQCEKILINLNLIHHMKLIDNSIKEKEGKLNEISKFNGHTKTICCLQFSKNSNSFLSAGFDNSIRCWKQINKKELKSSLPYTEHTDCIDCLIIDQVENQLVSGGRDNSMKIWKINFTDNQLTYRYSLNKHTHNVYSLCFNESEDTLISCGSDKQIIIWKKDSHQIWQFGCVVTID
ncbi:unnamed protein product [Paramecium octaurelia]|uniref:Uncharacterized protein n=1 Tax=Paramecium octaurelia TaxID=43137 RepID=A0A8S1TTG3_PAROT|nr:unnamed protein product [Paramecium octaurelia]